MATRPPKANTEPSVVEAQLEAFIQEELLEWYLMTPTERWDESQRLWATFTLLGGSLDPEPDSQSPFDDPGEPGRGPSDGGAGLHSVRRSGV